MIRFSENIRVLTDNFYSYGDAMIGRGPWREIRRSVKSDPIVKNSFLNKYFSARRIVRKRVFNKEFIDQTFKELDYSNKFNIEKDVLYIHLRAGDVLYTTNNLEDMSPQANVVITRRFKDLFITNLDLLNNKIQEYSGSFTKIIFVTAFHFSSQNSDWAYSDKNYKEVCNITDSFFTDFKKLVNIPFTVLHNDTDLSDTEFIDYHFYLLCNAHNAILDSGGFAEIIENYRNTT